MTALPTPQPATLPKLMSVADYLEGELTSEIKHEYIGGMIYAIAGGTITHNRIAGNLFAMLHNALQDKPCEPFNSDMKIRVQSPTQTRFYYPDCSVVCNPNPPDETYQDCPVVIGQVLSPTTHRVDVSEKKEAYLTIPSLSAYLLIEQAKPMTIVYRRGDQGFVREFHEGLNAVIQLPAIEVELPLALLYQGVV